MNKEENKLRRYCCAEDCDEDAEYELYFGHTPDDVTDSCKKHIFILIPDNAPIRKMFKINQETWETVGTEETEAVWEMIKKKSIHLCPDCTKEFATCKADPKFGTGEGNDNVYECISHDPRGPTVTIDGDLSLVGDPPDPNCKITCESGAPCQKCKTSNSVMNGKCLSCGEIQEASDGDNPEERPGP